MKSKFLIIALSLITLTSCQKSLLTSELSQKAQLGVSSGKRVNSVTITSVTLLNYPATTTDITTGNPIPWDTGTTPPDNEYPDPFFVIASNTSTLLDNISNHLFNIAVTDLPVTWNTSVTSPVEQTLSVYWKDYDTGRRNDNLGVLVFNPMDYVIGTLPSTIVITDGDLSMQLELQWSKK